MTIQRIIAGKEKNLFVFFYCSIVITGGYEEAVDVSRYFK